MILNINYSSTSAAAEAAANHVKAFFEAAFSDPITINISFNFAALGGLLSFAVPDGHYTYSQVRAALSSDATTADDSTVLGPSGSLPNVDITPGLSGLDLTTAQQKALGLRAAHDTTLDLTITFSTSYGYDFDRTDGITFNQYDFHGLAAYGISIGMGRLLERNAGGGGYSLLDAFDFSGTASHNFTGAASQAYFSLDNGQISLGDFAPNSILGDFSRASVGDDAFANVTSGALGVLNPISLLDLRELDVLGFNRVDDYGANAQMFGELRIPGGQNTASGTIELIGDHDWFRVPLLGGRHYRITLDGAPTSSGTLTDPILKLYNNSLNLVASDDDSGTGRNSLLYFTPLLNDYYYIDAAAFFTGNTITDTGTYTLRINAGSLPPSDFNGGWHSDILLQNVNSGAVHLWLMDGTSLNGNGAAGWTPGGNWQAKGTGDFNGDNRSDILLQNVANGACFIWELNGTSLVGSGAVGWTPGGNWQAKGTGDFNGDNKSDVLLQNVNDGSCYIWELNGTSLVGSGAVGWSPGAEWRARATGDFNGDGYSDILLQNVNNGACYIWELNGTSLVASGAVGWVPGANWQARTTGDYNGDGKSDILLQNADTGGCFIWLMNGTSLLGSGAVGWVPGAEWRATSGGDYNADGKSDILLQNANSGAAHMWLVDGTTLIGNSPVGWVPGADWHAI